MFPFCPPVGPTGLGSPLLVLSLLLLCGNHQGPQQDGSWETFWSSLLGLDGKQLSGSLHLTSRASGSNPTCTSLLCAWVGPLSQWCKTGRREVGGCAAAPKRFSWHAVTAHHPSVSPGMGKAILALLETLWGLGMAVRMRCRAFLSSAKGKGARGVK